MTSANVESDNRRAVDFAAGSPRFEDAELAELASREGAAAAWRRAFAVHGAQAPAKVSGSFSVVTRTGDGRLYAAVDRFAVKSLCWRVIDDVVHVHERADVLARLHPRAAIDPQAIHDYLYFHVIPAPRTIFKGVQRIPSGHCLSSLGEQVQVRAFWTPEFSEPKQGDFAALSEEFIRLLRAAVRRELTEGKPACFLSGGTDSSTVAGMIREVTGQPAASFSIGFDAAGYDEMAFARIAARRFGTQHHEHYVKPEDLVAKIPQVAAYYDQPFGNSSVLPAFCCAQVAREAGVQKLLAGDGGDELFGGNARYAKQRIFGWYDSVPGWLRRTTLEPLLLNSKIGNLPVASKARSYIGQARVPLPDRMEMYNLLHRLSASEVLEPALFAQVDPGEPLVQQRLVWTAPQSAGPLNRMLAFDWRFTLADSDVPKVCGATSLAGVSVGFPLLDDELLRFSQRLPIDYKLKGLKLRWFFKEALRGFLPDEILSKKKHGFGLPFGVWATQHSGLRSLAHDSLHALARRGVVRASFVNRLIRELLPTHPGYYGEMVWILMMLEQWWRHWDESQTNSESGSCSAD